MSSKNKIICLDCNWHGFKSDLQLGMGADLKDELYITWAYDRCPVCKSQREKMIACEVDGCWEPYTCGTYTNKGYKMTCYKHIPKPNKVNKSTKSHAKKHKVIINISGGIPELIQADPDVEIELRDYEVDDVDYQDLSVDSNKEVYLGYLL